MDPLDVPEPQFLRVHNPLRNGPTLVAMDAIYLEEEEIPWDEALEDEFFTLEPAPDRTVDHADWEDEFEEEIPARRTSVWPLVAFGGAIVALLVGASALVGVTALSDLRTAQTAAEVDVPAFVPPAPIPSAPAPEVLETGEDRAPHRRVRRPRRRRAPLSVSALPPARVSDLPPAL